MARAITASAPTVQKSISERSQALEAVQIQEASPEALQADANPQATGIHSEVQKVERKPGQSEFLRESLIYPSWQLLADAINGEIDKEAFTILQKAWEDPMLETVMTGRNQYIAMRSAWCIRTAAHAVPTDAELTALSERVLSKVNKFKPLRLPDNVFFAYLSTLYTVLAQQEDADKDLVKSLLMPVDKDAHINLKTAHLIAEGLIKPSARNDKAVQAALSTHDIHGGDFVILSCLLAKRRGGQLQQTFHEVFPDIARRNQLNGHVIVIISRIEASPRNIQFSPKP